MLRSMTGYGNGEYENSEYKFKVEMKSVNHRYNNVTIRMPYHINYLEEDIRKQIKAEVKRGSVDVYINLEYLNDAPVDVKVDLALAKAYKNAFEELIKEIDSKESISLEDLISMPDILSTERKEVDDELIKDALTKAVQLALDELVEMRRSEGEELKEDMMLKMEDINSSLDIIEERAPLVVVEYKERLEENIEELLDNETSLDEDKLSNEVAHFADRCSIDEEIVRLRSHIKQFENILDEAKVVGRKLDFLIQEFNREINTIGSKANDVIISENVVEMKADLEKIREQVQNIE